MAQIRPFMGVRYSRSKGLNFSALIAPPYDVLDEAAKKTLQERHPKNIVSVDLPHLPAKSVGPDDEYARAAVTLHSWMSSGFLERDTRPAIYPYTQTFTHGTRTFHRRGMIVAVKLSPFGEGHVIPHEKTYPEAIEDRLKLTRATQMQLSPVFGLYPDRTSEVAGLLYKGLGKPEITATLDDVRHDLWTISNSTTENALLDMMSTKPIYIADGHHRYTMAMQYQKEATARNGSPLPPKHPANFCMFTLVGLQDDGLLILPTHRLIGGLSGFDPAALRSAIANVADLVDTGLDEPQLPHYIDQVLPKQPPHTLGLFDGRTRKTLEIRFKDPDVLAKYAEDQSPAWRKLDVAIAQRFLLDEVLRPRFAAGKDPRRGYCSDSATVAAQVDAKQYQIAILLKSTPLSALEELGKTKEVMPPKSTYFFPKLATGMVLNPLE